MLDRARPLILACLTFLAACGQSEETPKAPTRTALPMPEAFAACQACHSTKAGTNQIGPSLAGLADRRAGTAPDFPYSDAIKKLDRKWTVETLSQFLLDPNAVAPGTKMVFGGTSTPEEAQQIAKYVLSLP